MTADPTPTIAPALRAEPRSWRAVLPERNWRCRHGHPTPESADACAEVEAQVPGFGDLGPVLRDYRKANGMLVEQVAQALECSDSKISRIETGQCRPSPRDVRDILAIYRVTGIDAEPLMDLARRARTVRRKGQGRRMAVPRAVAPPAPPVPLLAAAARLREP